MMKGLRFSLIAVLAFVLPTLAWSAKTPKFGFSERGITTEISESSSLLLSSEVVSSSVHTGSSNAYTQTSFVVPRGTQFVIVAPASGPDSGWSATATGGVSWTASITGTAGGGDNWGLMAFQAVTWANGGQEYYNLNLGQEGGTIYLHSGETLPPLTYAITWGTQTGVY